MNSVLSNLVPKNRHKRLLGEVARDSGGQKTVCAGSSEPLYPVSSLGGPKTTTTRLPHEDSQSFGPTTLVRGN